MTSAREPVPGHKKPFASNTASNRHSNEREQQ
jgi:hypothetical protein